MNDCFFEKKDWRECKQEVRFSDLIFGKHHVRRRSKDSMIIKRKEELTVLLGVA